MTAYHKIKPNQLHLWIADLDVSESLIKSLSETLSNDEKIRAQRFRFPQHQNRFIVARGLLRKTLADYLRIKPAHIKFEYNQKGKPRISGGGIDRLEFNISHSQNLALYGITLNRPIGVDLEYIRDFEQVEPIAQRFFTPQEYQQIKSLPKPQQQETFFRAWTAKEAYLKATGEGLSGGLDTVEIELNRKQPLKLISINQNPQAANHWRLYELNPAPNYQAAIAIQTSENLDLQKHKI